MAPSPCACLPPTAGTTPVQLAAITSEGALTGEASPPTLPVCMGASGLHRLLLQVGLRLAFCDPRPTPRSTFPRHLPPPSTLGLPQLLQSPPPAPSPVRRLPKHCLNCTGVAWHVPAVCAASQPAGHFTRLTQRVLALCTAGSSLAVSTGGNIYAWITDGGVISGEAPLPASSAALQPWWGCMPTHVSP